MSSHIKEQHKTGGLHTFDNVWADTISQLQHTMSDTSDPPTLTEEQRLTLCRAAINQIYVMLRDNPRSWRNYLTLARSIISHLDSTTFMQSTARGTEQAWMLTAIQKIAFADADNGSITDLDTWTARHWLAMLQRDARNIVALRGMGWAWLQRAQPALSRIHRLDGASSSSGGSAASQALTSSVLNGDEERIVELANAEAERRAGTADYVEARGFLQPSTEYFARAVAVALSADIRSGELLATVSIHLPVIVIAEFDQAAEAFMSMGNASSPRTNEPFFRRAVQLLRAANDIEGYTLPSHLQQYVLMAAVMIDTDISQLSGRFWTASQLR